IRHVCSARDPRHVALCFGVVTRPLSEVLLLLFERGGFIRNFPAFNDALPRRHRADRARLPPRSGMGGMIQQVPGRGVHRLPNSIQVRMSIEPRGAVRGSLTDHRRSSDQEDKPTCNTISHSIDSTKLIPSDFEVTFNVAVTPRPGKRALIRENVVQLAV